MNIDQAYKILDYGTVPQNRAEQIQLIQVMGYTRLRGGNIISECHDRQLHKVAQRLFKEAEQTVHENSRIVIKEERYLFQYHSFLCDIFNIDEEQRDSVSISELEEMLMQ